MSHFIPALQSMGTALLAGVSVASIVIGLAAQSTLSNLIAGVVLIVYRPFNPGDRIQLAAPTGLEIAYVKDITLGYTMLETSDQQRIVVPNSQIASQITINLTQSEKRTPLLIPFHLLAGVAIDQARSILTETASKHEKVLELAGCRATQVDGAGITLTLKVWCENVTDAATVQSDLMEQVVERFRDQQMGLAFPSDFVPTVS